MYSLSITMPAASWKVLHTLQGSGTSGRYYDEKQDPRMKVRARRRRIINTVERLQDGSRFRTTLLAAKRLLRGVYLPAHTNSTLQGRSPRASHRTQYLSPRASCAASSSLIRSCSFFSRRFLSSAS